MNRDKQIETTDWLTRGISKEQLEREKREAIMSADLQGCITYDEWSAREYGIDSIDFDTTAEKMVAKGYHKQSEGEWIFHKDGSATCNQCNTTQKHIWDMDNYQSYCGHCGSKMKGGAE